MKLPKSVTTVTPFSKFLALFLFILLPFVGFYIGISYQHKIDAMSNTQVSLPTSVHSSAMNTVTITLKDTGQTVHAKVGDTILVSLGDQQNWHVQLSDESILQPFANGVFYINMPQGRYKAVAPGTVNISATGSAKCLRGSMCPMYMIEFQTTVVVTP